LRAGQHAAEPGNTVEALPVETENPRTSVDPESAIRRYVQRVDFGGARQRFGGCHETKAGPVIPVQSTFRTGPDITRSVLRQR
jgi:hypothetical protein